METLQVVFRNLYTGFLLRDFAGKIVPGFLLIFPLFQCFDVTVQVVDSGSNI
jgi:hypothetical protein